MTESCFLGFFPFFSCTCSNFQPSDMVETICVSSSSWHCSTRYTCFTGPWGTHTHTHKSESHKKSYFGGLLVWLLAGPAVLLYLRCPVLIVPYPFLHQPHQRCNVIELGLLQNTWGKGVISLLGWTRAFFPLFYAGESHREVKYKQISSLKKGLVKC